MSYKLRDEPQTLGEALKDVAPWARLAIGLFASGAVGVYVPLCVVALFGIWQNNITMWGFNAISIALLALPNAIGRLTSSVWWGALVYGILLCGYGIKLMVAKEPVSYWIVYWPLYFTIIFGSILNAACFVWFAKQTGLSWRRRGAKGEVG